MSCPSYEMIIDSPIFTFVVGEEKKEIKVHSVAIASLSPALDKLMNGSMTEAKAKCAVVDDVAPQTFLLLCQYAYTGDYQVVRRQSIEQQDENSNAKGPQANLTAKEVDQEAVPASPFALFPSSPNHPSTAFSFSPAHVQRPAGFGSAGSTPVQNSAVFGSAPPAPVQSSPIFGLAHRTLVQPAFGTAAPTPVQSSPALDASASALEQDSNKMTKRSKLRKKFHDTSYGDKPRFPPASLPDGLGTTTYVAYALKEHAQLYVLASKYDVQSLQQQCLGKIHKLLSNLASKVSSLATARGVLEVIDYIYGEDEPVTAENDACRDLLASYVACYHDAFSKHDEFLQLLRGGGNFVTDFWKIVNKRLL